MEIVLADLEARVCHYHIPPLWLFPFCHFSGSESPRAELNGPLWNSHICSSRVRSVALSPEKKTETFVLSADNIGLMLME